MSRPPHGDDVRTEGRAAAGRSKQQVPRDQALAIGMLMAPVRWTSLLLALTLVVAALPGLSQTLPGADAAETTTEETTDDLTDTVEDTTQDTGTASTIDDTTGTLDEAAGTDDAGELLDDTSDPSPVLDDGDAGATEDERSASAECVPHESGDGRLVCTVSVACIEDLYTTLACSPPPQCLDQGNATFECYPRTYLQDLVEPGPHAAPWTGTPACLPSPTMWDVLVCEPPAVCLGDLATTQACRPSPACRLEDGRWYCSLTAPGSTTQQPEALAIDPGSLDHEALEREVQAVVKTSMAPFRGAIDQLRDEYETGLAEIQANHTAERGLAHDAYLACLDAAGDPGSEAACRQAALDELDALRSAAYQAEAELRERLLEEAEQLREATCQALASQLDELTSMNKQTQRLEDVVDTRSLALCQDTF